jgi:hypothetical protein
MWIGVTLLEFSLINTSQTSKEGKLSDRQDREQTCSIQDSRETLTPWKDGSATKKTLSPGNGGVSPNFQCDS